MATPLAQAEYERLYETLTGGRTGRKPVHATLATHWARVVELVFACESVALQARDDEITSDKIHTPPTSIVGEGVGIVEAPRGLLTHHYKTDEKGFVKEANLIVGTTNNNAAISMSAFRAYDPCFGCATHALPGRMPMEIVFRGLDGTVRETIRRFC
jgi:F420-non-reducing hydrogenase large subunit